MKRLMLAIGLIVPGLGAPARAAESFAGSWQTTYGPMTLTQQSDRITGFYVYQGQRCSLRGAVAGNRFTFHYQEPTIGGEGWFVLAADGRSFSGKWREQGSTAWGSWKGTRLTKGRQGFEEVGNTHFGRVRIVLISDTDDPDNGAIYKYNSERLSKIFQDANAADSARPYDAPVLVQGKRVTSRDILKTIAELPVRAGVDTVAVFYWGHGGSDAQRSHYLTLSSKENMLRNRIVSAIQARRPRLGVLLSDTCNRVHPWLKQIIVRAPVVRINGKAVRALFLQQRGLCDVNSCKLGQFSFNLPLDPNRKVVSIFTKYFVEYLYSDMAEDIATPAAATDWPTFLRVVGEAANREFIRQEVGKNNYAREAGQTSQDPYSWSLPMPLTGTSATEPPRKMQTWMAPDPLPTPEHCTLQGKVPINDGVGDKFTIYGVFRSNTAPDYKPILKTDGGELIHAARTVEPAGPNEVYEVKLQITPKVFKDAELKPGRQVVRVYWLAWNVGKRVWVKAEDAWPSGIRLLVDRANDGTVSLLPFVAGAEGIGRESASETIAVQACRLNVQHLIPRPGLSAFLLQTKDPKMLPQPYLRLSSRSAGARSLERGVFFGPIDTPEKAAELVTLSCEGWRLIQTREQYLALKKGLESRGWKSPDHLRADLPPSFGLRVREIADAGYVVDLLAITCGVQRGATDRLFSVVYSTWTVTREGKLYPSHVTYIVGPYFEVGAPPLPPMPLENRAYTNYVKTLLTDAGSEVIPSHIAPTDKKISVPVPGGLKREWIVPFKEKSASRLPAPTQPVFVPTSAQLRVAYLDTIFLGGDRDGNISLRGWFRIPSSLERAHEARLQRALEIRSHRPRILAERGLEIIPYRVMP